MKHLGIIYVLLLEMVEIALQRGCELIFTIGEDDNEREISRANGFVDCGSMVCYAKKNDIMVSCWWPLEYGRLAYKGMVILDKVCAKYNKTPAQASD